MNVFFFFFSFLFSLFFYLAVSFLKKKTSFLGSMENSLRINWSFKSFVLLLVLFCFGTSSLKPVVTTCLEEVLK